MIVFTFQLPTPLKVNGSIDNAIKLTMNPPPAPIKLALIRLGQRGEKGDRGEQGIQGDKGDIGLTGEQGVQGIQGLKGDKGDYGSPYQFTQTIPARHWIINHNLGRNVHASIYSTGGSVVWAEVMNTSINQVQVFFDAQQAGYALII